MAKYIEHAFYCPLCGLPTLPIRRLDGKMKKKFHRKKLYCFHCKVDVNCIECRTEQEIAEFKEQYERGDFKDEAEESLRFCQENEVII